jgi:hypothetical protein
MSTRPHPPCYRVSFWSGSRWSPVVTRTREPMKLIRQLERQGIDRRRLLIERRPGQGIAMGRPDAPAPRVAAGRVIG